MSEKGLKLAIVGCGGMAHGHLNGYVKIKEKEPNKFDFAAMCDPVAERAQKFADETAKVQDSTPAVYTDLDEMLNNEDLDAVDICSRHSDHHVNGIACLDAGANIMIEKPFGVTIKASKLLIEAAKRNGKIAATAENIRRGLSQRTAHWLINEKKMIGDPRFFFSQMATWKAPDPPNWHWRLDHMMGGGGMVMDSGAEHLACLAVAVRLSEEVFLATSSEEALRQDARFQKPRRRPRKRWPASRTGTGREPVGSNCPVVLVRSSATKQTCRERWKAAPARFELAMKRSWR